MIPPSFKTASEVVENSLETLRAVESLAARGQHSQAMRVLRRAHNQLMQVVDTIYEVDDDLAAVARNAVCLGGSEGPVYFKSAHRAAIQLLFWFIQSISRSNVGRDDAQWQLPSDSLKQYNINVSELSAALGYERAMLTRRHDTGVHEGRPTAAKKRGRKSDPQRDARIAREYEYGILKGLWKSQADYVRQKHEDKTPQWLSLLLKRVADREEGKSVK